MKFRHQQRRNQPRKSTRGGLAGHALHAAVVAQCPSGVPPAVSPSQLTIASLGSGSWETPAKSVRQDNEDYWRSGHQILMEQQSALLQGHRHCSSVHWTPVITVCRPSSSSHFKILFAWKSCSNWQGDVLGSPTPGWFPTSGDEQFPPQICACNPNNLHLVSQLLTWISPSVI